MGEAAHTEYVVSDRTLALSKDPRVSPLFAPDEILDDMPPALVITAEFDPLCDEGEEYAHRLNSLGVECSLVRYFGQVHGFFNLLHAGIDDAFLVVSHVSNDIYKALQDTPVVDTTENVESGLAESGQAFVAVGKKKRSKGRGKSSKTRKAASDEKKKKNEEVKRQAAEAALRVEHSNLKHSAVYRGADLFARKLVAGDDTSSMDSGNEKSAKVTPFAATKVDHNATQDVAEGMDSTSITATSTSSILNPASESGATVPPKQLFGPGSTPPLGRD